MLKKAFTCRVVPFWAVYMLFVAGAHAQEETTPQDTAVLVSVSGPAVNAMKYIGRSVRFTGVVKQVLSPGIPIELLMDSNGSRWIAQVFNFDSIPDTVLVPGKRITVWGMIMGISKPRFIGGTSRSFLLVMSTRAEVAGGGKKGKGP